MQLTRASEALKRAFDGETTQQQVAERIGVFQSAISRWSNGNGRPPAHHRKALFDLLGIPEEHWLTSEEAARLKQLRKASTTEGYATSHEERKGRARGASTKTASGAARRAARAGGRSGATEGAAR